MVMDYMRRSRSESKFCIPLGRRKRRECKFRSLSRNIFRSFRLFRTRNESHGRLYFGEQTTYSVR